MRSRRIRRWESRDHDDPLSGLVNLFDLWMVFSIALLIVCAGSSSPRARSSPGDRRQPGDPQPVALRQARSIERYKVGRNELTGSGEKLGTAYRLASGEIVCVPDATEVVKKPPSPTTNGRGF